MKTSINLSAAMAVLAMGVLTVPGLAQVSIEDNQSIAPRDTEPHGNAATALNAAVDDDALNSPSPVDYSATAAGGIGGAGDNSAAGNGGAATATTDVENEGAGDLKTSADATGGDGGGYGGPGGNGGLATSTSTSNALSSTATGIVESHSTATGGKGGFYDTLPSVDKVTGAGGAAVANARAISVDATTTNAVATANGGDAGGNSGGSLTVPGDVVGKTGGDATADAKTFSAAGVVTYALSTANAGSGTVGFNNGTSLATAAIHTSATLSGGTLVTAEAKTTGGVNAADLGSGSTSSAHVSFAGDQVELFPSGSNTATGVYAPAAEMYQDFLNPDMSGLPELADAFGSDQAVKGIGGLSVYASAAFDPEDEDAGSFATVTYSFAPGEINGSLVVAFLSYDGVPAGGNPSQTYELWVNGVAQPTPLVDVDGFLSISTLSLFGAEPLEVQLRLSLTDAAAEEGFSGTYLIGGSLASVAVPEPATLGTAALALGAGLLARRRRHG